MYIRNAKLCRDLFSATQSRFSLLDYSYKSVNSSISAINQVRYVSLSQCLKKDDETVIIGGVSKKLTGSSKPELVPTKFGIYITNLCFYQ